MKQIGELLQQVLQETTNNSNVFPGIASGFKDLDRSLGGFENSDLIVVGARPAMGKTAFLISLAINMAKQGVPVLFYSLEMSNVQIVKRIISNVSGIDGHKIRSGQLTSDELTLLLATANEIGQYPLYISDTTHYTIEDFCLKVEADVIFTHAKVVFVDYLQLLSSSEKLQNRYEEVDLCTRMLKHLANRLAIPVIVSSQLNRKVENRPSPLQSEKIPLLHDLRDSGTICDDANVVLFLHRPEYYLQSSQDENGNDIRGLAEVIIAKNHMGPTDRVRLKFIPQTCKFEDWISESDSSPFAFGNPDISPSPF